MEGEGGVSKRRGYWSWRGACKYTDGERESINNRTKEKRQTYTYIDTESKRIETECGPLLKAEPRPVRRAVGVHNVEKGKRRVQCGC